MRCCGPPTTCSWQQGYGRTTIADIARAAAVSPETIYATFKTKATLLHRVWDVTIGGDDAGRRLPRAAGDQGDLRAEPDLAKRLMVHARMSTATARRMAPFLLAVRAAAGAEPAAAEMVAEIDRQRLAGLGVMAADAAATGQLAVTEQECRDLIWAMTDGGCGTDSSSSAAGPTSSTPTGSAGCGSRRSSLRSAAGLASD